MSRAVVVPPYLATIRAAANRPNHKTNTKAKTARTKRSGGGVPDGFGVERKEPRYQYVEGCGACSSPPLKKSSQQTLLMLRSSTFLSLGAGNLPNIVWNRQEKVPQGGFSCCRDTIKVVFGSKSKELENFNHTIKSVNSSCDVHSESPSSPL